MNNATHKCRIFFFNIALPVGLFTDYIYHREQCSDYFGELILSCGQGWDVLDATKGFSIGTNFCHFSLWNWP